MTTKKSKQIAKIVTGNGNNLPDGMVGRIDKACDLLLECMDVNNLTKSEGVSAMASILSSILAQQEDDKHFYAVIKMMKLAFEEHRKK